MTKTEKIEFLRNKDTISPKEMAMLFGGNPYAYNVAAKQGALGVSYVWRGKNLRIFSEPLIRVLEGDNEQGGGSVFR